MDVLARLVAGDVGVDLARIQLCAPGILADADDRGRELVVVAADVGDELLDGGDDRGRRVRAALEAVGARQPADGGGEALEREVAAHLGHADVARRLGLELAVEEADGRGEPVERLAVERALLGCVGGQGDHLLEERRDDAVDAVEVEALPPVEVVLADVAAVVSEDLEDHLVLVGEAAGSEERLHLRLGLVGQLVVALGALEGKVGQLAVREGPLDNHDLVVLHGVCEEVVRHLTDLR